MKGDQTETVERATMLKMDREGSGESLAHRIGGQLRKAGNRGGGGELTRAKEQRQKGPR